jgi:glycosyltransferase involved in cell wall biosynthesis
MKKSCIILSQGPVPTPEHTKVEGGGLRCWGLARGLRLNNSDLDITVAYHDSYKKEQFTQEHEGIRIATWTIEQVPDLIAAYDTVLVSYCMGELSVAVADAIRPDQQLVLDCYVPIYVEVSARDTDDLEGEYRAFHGDVGRWSHVLTRGDLFLCASEAQKQYYKGVLSGVGRINPATYGKDMIRIVPYGIYHEEPTATEKPITKMLDTNDKDVKKILWFGGIYPWFDLRNLVDAVKRLNDDVPARLVIVGAKNPFNNHPDFVRPYEELMAHIEADKRLKDVVLIQEWVDFEKRADWYLDSDLVVVVNKIGPENELAWRTRLVDFLWADLPILTNGGDPLGEELLGQDAAARLHGLSVEEVAKGLRELLRDTGKLQGMQKKLRELKKSYYWDTVTELLARDISNHTRAYDLEAFGNQQMVIGPPTGSRSKVKRAVTKAKMIPAYARKYGAKNTYFAIRTKVGNQFRKVNVTIRNTPGVVMIAHQMDNSGAPYVFLDLARSILKENPGIPLDFHTFNPTNSDNIGALNKLGIKPKIHIVKDIEIPIVQGDVIILNTVAHATVLKTGIYNALESGQARKLAWYIHEDDPELLFTKQEISRLQRLLAADKVLMLVPARKTLENYRRVFEHTKNIRLQPYQYVVPQQFQKVRSANDFDTLSFILPGTVGDGRKGQLPIFYALAMFAEKYYKVDPKAYRDYELVYVGLTHDFLSRQLLNHAEKLFGDKFKHHAIVSHEKSLQLMMDSNVTLCYSLREALPLFVFEGMAAGHPVLRNDSSGFDEQLFEGKNGFYLDSRDFDQVVDTFERVLNKKKTTNEQLAAMSGYSNKVALAQGDHSYDQIMACISADSQKAT